MDDLHLTLLRTIARNARLADMDIALSWQVLHALLDEIDLLRSGLQASTRKVVEMQATLAVVEAPPLAGVRVSAPEPTDIICTCGKAFVNQRALTAHLQRSKDHAWERSNEDIPNDEPLACPYCDADGFKDKRGLGGHIWGKHHIRASEMKAL